MRAPLSWFTNSRSLATVNWTAQISWEGVQGHPFARCERRQPEGSEAQRLDLRATITLHLAFPITCLEISAVDFPFNFWTKGDGLKFKPLDWVSQSGYGVPPKFGLGGGPQHDLLCGQSCFIGRLQWQFYAHCPFSDTPGISKSEVIMRIFYSYNHHSILSIHRFWKWYLYIYIYMIRIYIYNHIYIYTYTYSMWLISKGTSRYLLIPSIRQGRWSVVIVGHHPSRWHQIAPPLRTLVSTDTLW